VQINIENKLLYLYFDDKVSNAKVEKIWIDPDQAVAKIESLHRSGGLHLSMRLVLNKIKDRCLYIENMKKLSKKVLRDCNLC
jgi:hypothetical protein